jgi:multiple sugar transport system substrate-binding protein
VKGKKTIALMLVLILILSLSLAGCAKEATVASAPQEKAAVEPAEQVVVEFWHGCAAEKNEVLLKMIEKYQSENPNVKINPKFVANGDEMLQKVQSAVLSNQEPNLLWGYPTWTGVLESSGKLVEVGAIMDDGWKNDIPKGLMEAGMYKNKIYSVPIEAGTLLLIYNKDMFKEVGIENPPTTWDELYNMSKKLSDGKRFGVWLPIAPNERTAWTWECFLWQNGQSILNKEGNNIGFNNEKGLEALDFYTKMIKDGYAPIAVGQDPFIDKQVAMAIGTQGAANTYITKQKMNVGVAMLPGKDQLASGLGSNHYFMFKSDEKVQQETLKFMKWMTTGENHAEWAIKTGYLPVAKSARESAKYIEFGKENPHMIEAAKVLTYGVARPPIEEYPKLSSIISEVIQKIAYKEMTVEEGMKNIADKANDIFK